MEETYKGFQIRYSENSGEFIAAIGDSTYQNSNLVSVKKYIDKLDKKDFKRIDVIVESYGEMQDAVVTSYPEGQSKTYQECWISFKDKSRYDSRRKINIKQVFLDNPHNREILTWIKGKEVAIARLKKEINQFKETLETYNPDA